MKNILTIFLTGVVLACNDSNQVTEATGSNTTSTDLKTTIPTNKEPGKNEGGCFMKITGRDTAIIILEQKENDLTGRMLYDNFEKDGSHGTVKGKQDGDILKLFYDFNSEGMRSVMEVYFKKVPGGLLRGVGDMNVKGDTTYFTSGINYSDKEAFSKVDCETVKGRFQ
jgi:hypothetical protein